MIENGSLYKACRVWLEAALTEIRSKPAPLTSDYRVVWESEGAFKLIPVPILDTPIFLHDHYSALVNLPELQELLHIVQASTDTASVLLSETESDALSSDGLAASLYRSHFEKFLISYLRWSDEWDSTDSRFYQDRFDAVYARLEQYIRGPASVDAAWLYPILNLTLEVDVIMLTSEVKLRQTTQAEREQAVKEFSWTRNSRMNVLLGEDRLTIPTAVLEVRRALTHRDAVSFGPDDYIASHHLAEALLLALRLIRPEQVSIDVFRTLVQNPFMTVSPGLPAPTAFPYVWRRPSNIAFSRQYVLTSTEVDELQSLFARAASTRSNSSLAVPLKRLDDSYGRTNLADRLIDYWVALEGLFLPEKHTREMTEVVAQSIAHYLGETESERRSIAALVHSSHSVRSSVVHGRRVEDKNLDLTVAKTGNLLRRSLRKRLAE